MRIAVPCPRGRTTSSSKGRLVGLGMLVAAACGHAGVGYPPPCQAGVHRSDCARLPPTESARPAAMPEQADARKRLVRSERRPRDADGTRYVPRPVKRDARECQTDADCVVAGCANACVPFSSRDVTTECIERSDPPFCGCVGGECSWFDQ